MGVGHAQPGTRAHSRRKRKRGKLTDRALVACFLIGLLVFLYPTISNYVNSLRQGRAIAQYDAALAQMRPQDFTNEWQAVDSYNQALLTDRSRMHPAASQLEQYNSILNIAGSSMMGHLDIKKLRVSLPIYHSVDDSVLQAGVGHIPGTSLPGGGPSTHVVLSGHRGLPTSKLFTDLDRLVEGDRFTLHVLDRSLSYEVDQIRVVEPKDVASIQIEQGQDYVTLVTCTPYAINTHRLLVRGHRVTAEEADYVVADAITIDPALVSSVIAIPILTIIFISLIGGARRKRASSQPRPTAHSLRNTDSEGLHND